jgi:Ni/Fe-hydrogenase subunit HybB-like protein
MEIKFEQIDGRSPQYYLTLVVLAVLAVAGLVATWWASHSGLWVTGMTQRVPWGLQIVMAVYYIGLSAGSLVISGLYGVFGKLEYKPFARLAVYMAMLFLIAGLLSILTDQGRLDRVFIEPFVYFNLQSMFSINPILYIGHILICVVYLWALFYERKTLTKVVATLAFGWAFCVHSGTGAIFGYGARVLYESPLLPAAFVAAAMASGTALMIVMIVARALSGDLHSRGGVLSLCGECLPCLCRGVAGSGPLLPVRGIPQRAVLGRASDRRLLHSHVHPVQAPDGTVSTVGRVCICAGRVRGPV